MKVKKGGIVENLRFLKVLSGRVFDPEIITMPEMSTLVDIPLGAGTVWTVKQSFSMNTLVECECVEGRTGHLSTMSALVVELSQLEHKLKEMTMLVSQKDAEIALLKAQLAKAQIEGPGSAEVSKLKAKSEALLAQNAELKEKLVKSNDAANDDLSLVIQSLTRKPSST
ncbi:hypothetical protein R3W88_000980 [Solanum pinnatisectum]|uniref:Uncharacterized protein n=1 Tax=Solanum pinnatisectum TaxID=50273 RepID=A0AAV9MHG4_9SOLN|nr:hypothetical protein R3W88_000980 [Solanum pinnatisectum]